MALTMRGPSAEVRVGYETAARLGAWELVKDADGFTLSAPVLERNGYWLDSGRCLDLCVTVGKSMWRWRDVALDGDNPVTVRGAGRPEIR